MNLQFADLNADGHDDIVTATFEGTSMVIFGSKDGWTKPEHLKDSQNRNLVISLYYDMEENEYKNADRSASGETHQKDHCVSTTAMDWDGDGDLDLLLGAEEGRLYLRKNLGSASKPKFADENLLVKADGEDLMIHGGLTAAQPFDWDLDGDQDLICGSFAGGVHFVENTAAKGGEVSLAKPKKLLDGKIDLGGDEPLDSKDWYATPGDFDKDGKLDLLVGMQVKKQPKQKKLTDKEKKELKKADDRLNEIQAAFSKKLEEAQDKYKELSDKERRKAMQKMYEEDEEIQKMSEEMSELYETIGKLRPFQRLAAGVYLFKGT